jgi:hypothetical protein
MTHLITMQRVVVKQRMSWRAQAASAKMSNGINTYLIKQRAARNYVTKAKQNKINIAEL